VSMETHTMPTHPTTHSFPHCPAPPDWALEQHPTMTASQFAISTLRWRHATALSGMMNSKPLGREGAGVPVRVKLSCPRKGRVRFAYAPPDTRLTGPGVRVKVNRIIAAWKGDKRFTALSKRAAQLKKAGNNAEQIVAAITAEFGPPATLEPLRDAPQPFHVYGWVAVTRYGGWVEGTLLVVVSHRQEIFTIIILSHE